MTTRLDKIKADDALNLKLAHVSYGDVEVGKWMLQNGYNIPAVPNEHDILNLDDLLSAIAMQGAERAVTPSKASE